MAELIEKKSYPLNYSTDVLDIISTMSMTNGRNVVVAGSMSLKSQQYAGDYDLVETVNGKYKNTESAINAYVKRFQSIIKNLMKMKNVYIGDIKAGMVSDWIVIPDNVGIKKNRVVGYNAPLFRSKVKELYDTNIITKEEYDYSMKQLINNPTIDEFLLLKKELRFHLVRWTPDDVLKGKITLRNNRVMTLQEAFVSPTIIKLDAIGYIQSSRFVDFSIIYLLKNKGKAINNVDTKNEIWAIKQDLLYYLASNNYYKASKRLFTLANIKNDLKLIEQLTEMFNSDLGRLYSIISDLNTILFLLDNEHSIPVDKIKYELDGIRTRLGNIYSISDVDSDRVLKDILKTSALPTNKDGRVRLKEIIENLVDKFQRVLDLESKGYLESKKIAPFPVSYLP